MPINGKKVTIMGAGPKTLLPLLEFLRSHDCRILVSEKKNDTGLLEKIKDIAGDIEVEIGGHTDKIFVDKDIIILSPGVPVDLPILLKARGKGVTVWSELELAFRYSAAPFIAVTGTNGKSTVTTLLGQYLQGLPYKTVVAGNIGIPLIGVIGGLTEKDRIVAEVSSFQLEAIESFAPHISCILNITPDHLDRHKTMENYISCKKAIFRNQNAKDTIFLNADDPITARMYSEEILASPKYFSLTKKSADFYRADDYFYQGSDGRRILALQHINVPGGHNRANILAAIAIATFMGVNRDYIENVTANFRGLPHVMEFVGAINGITYINDSKGTNPAATISAITQITGKKVLIAGGQERGSGYKDLASCIAKHVDYLILLGENKQTIRTEVLKTGFRNIFLVDSLKEAVEEANLHAEERTTVILSPASPSWDQFSNYAERGNYFKKLINDL